MVLVVGENRTFLSKTKQRRKAIIVLVPYALRCPTLLLLCYVSIRFFLPFQGGGTFHAGWYSLTPPQGQKLSKRE